MSDPIRQYWEERASRSRGESTATTDDVYLRELEIATIVATIKEIGVAPGQSVMDIGCGDGYSTSKIADAFPELQVFGLDFSQQMIAIARERLAARPDLQDRLRFELGDVTNLDASCGKSKYSIILTDRCLINLASFERQRQALASIAGHLKPGGTIWLLRILWKAMRT
ncbi:MAG: class I SAM-dependent methyltransferase [Burkholderiales bacterium]|nr:class I SAM-dependent methyltransferase [Burkholderiales bacterium]